MKSALEKALVGAAVKSLPAQTVSWLLNHFRNAWLSNLKVACGSELKLPESMSNSYARVIAFGLMMVLFENGYKVELCRDLRLNEEEYIQLLNAVVLLRNKMDALAPTAPQKSLTKTLYDRIRQVGR